MFFSIPIIHVIHVDVIKKYVILFNDVICIYFSMHLLLTGRDRVGYLSEMSTIKTTRLIVHRNNTRKVLLVSSPFLVSCVCKSGGGGEILG